MAAGLQLRSASRGRGLLVGGTTAIAAASFGAVAGGTVTSGWLSPAAACLRRRRRSVRRGGGGGECAQPGAISPVPAWRTLNTFDGRLLPSLSASLRWVRAAAAESARRMACA